MRLVYSVVIFPFPSARQYYLLTRQSHVPPVPVARKKRAGLQSFSTEDLQLVPRIGWGRGETKDGASVLFLGTLSSS